MVQPVTEISFEGSVITDPIDGSLIKALFLRILHLSHSHSLLCLPLAILNQPLTYNSNSPFNHLTLCDSHKNLCSE